MQKEKFTIAMLVANKQGVLTRIAGLFAKRAYNIENLSVGKTEDPTISRMTIVTECDENIKMQIVKQLDKLVDVKYVGIMEKEDSVMRELMLIKIKMIDKMNTEVLEAINVFRAKVIDMTPQSIIVEVTGQNDKLNAFLSYMERYGILEISRTGLTALDRGAITLDNRC